MTTPINFRNLENRLHDAKRHLQERSKALGEKQPTEDQLFWDPDRGENISKMVYDSITLYYTTLNSHNDEIAHLNTEIFDRDLEIGELKEEVINARKEINANELELGCKTTQLGENEKLITTLKDKEKKICGISHFAWGWIFRVLLVIFSAIFGAFITWIFT